MRVCFSLSLSLCPWGCSSASLGPLIKDSHLNSGISIPSKLPELFSAALPPPYWIYCLEPQKLVIYNKCTYSERTLGGGPWSFSWSFSQNLAGCMLVSVNPDICLPHSSHNSKPAFWVRLVCFGGCTLTSRPLALPTIFSLPLYWLTCRVNSRRQKDSRSLGLGFRGKD